jgi:hypothetical protein
MARVKDNLLLKGLSGSVGKDHVLRTINKNTFSCKYPDMSGVIPSKNQTKGRARFAEAVKFAQSVIRDPGKAARYKTEPGISVYHAFIREFLNRLNPKIYDRLSLQSAIKSSLKSQSLKDPQLRAIAYIHKHKKLTNGVYQKMNGVSKPTDTRHLNELASQNIIKSHGD